MRARGRLRAAARGNREVQTEGFSDIYFFFRLFVFLFLFSVFSVFVFLLKLHLTNLLHYLSLSLLSSF